MKKKLKRTKAEVPTQRKRRKMVNIIFKSKKSKTIRERDERAYFT